ncbi:Cysteine synthase [Symbiodinium microadriaticum]|uniref:Cysteine synthase n=1 Tax=Symbiodinium microadriaticum TaxID=2951 RepID=A0A1Q9C8W8_SYMMI|nr:Cysteine synthase [Symbiodinium microadriaticum]
MELTVDGDAGELTLRDLSPSCSIRDVHEELQRRSGVPVKQQLLTFSGAVLGPSKTLGELDCSPLHLTSFAQLVKLSPLRLPATEQRGIQLSKIAAALRRLTKPSMQMSQLEALIRFLAERSCPSGLVPWRDRWGSRIFLKDLNLYHLADWVICPSTAEDKCSYVELIASDAEAHGSVRRGLRFMSAGLSPGTSDRGLGRGRLYDNITETVGNTPCVKISDAISPLGRTIYGKLEFFNPLSSAAQLMRGFFLKVKDRLACGIIEDAERTGQLKPGDTVIEASSGNTGIGVAMLCAQCVIVMAEPYSIERRKLMRFLGAKVVITPREFKGTGMGGKAKELADAHGWFLCRQFDNDVNAETHYTTTGREILNDFKGMTLDRRKLDYFVTGYGTGGTFAGAGVVMQMLPSNNETGGVASGIKTEQNPDGSIVSHPAFQFHPIQVWYFLKALMLAAAQETGYDEYIPVPSDAAIDMSQALAKTQGILTGISGGASMYAAVEVAKKAPEGSVVVAMIPERYLSTQLFASIDAEMNDEELAISKSTPNFQF